MVALRQANTNLKLVHKQLLVPEQKQDWAFAPGTDLKKLLKVYEGSHKPSGVLAEFVGNDDFATAFRERRRYQIDAGRDDEPILYTPLYNVIEDASLPEFVPVLKLGPAGVVLERVIEGGETKFATVSSSQESVQIQHFAVGLEYTKDMMVFNRLWQLGFIERQAGRAYNALLNHAHLYPIIDYTYGTDNQTAASASGSTLVEKYLRSVEAAITAARQKNRRGPYWLLVSDSDFFTMERALSRVPQQGIELQSSAIDLIRGVIAYDGWTGIRGNKEITYPGVPTGKAYLVSLGYREEDMQSYMKQSLQATMGNEDVSRFIMEQTIWDTYFGVYANPLRSVQEITLPTS